MCTWIVDADQIQMSDFKDALLYRTATVNSFLDSDRHFGIEAPKGLGKTYLLKCKRMISQAQGILCLPQDAMCDILDKVTFEESMSKYLEDYVNWVDLWKAAICISILKSQKEIAETLLSELDNHKDQFFLKIYSSAILFTPCQIMNRLINSERPLIRGLQIRIPVYIAMLTQIRQPIHVFIDKTDQALRDNLHFIRGSSKMSRGPSNRSYWAYGQFALAEAAYQLFIQNSHIKVFFSIRSEALVGAEDYTNLFLQLRSYIVKLEYSPYEIEQMFKHYISLEDDQWLLYPEDRNNDPAKAFIGISTIKHGYVTDMDGEQKVEPLFSYIFRHTLKRPRDLMHICYSLCFSPLRNIKDEVEYVRKIRHIVNHQSMLLLQSYIREMGPFVFDDNTAGWDIFWSTVATNAFSYEYAQEVCNLINASIAPRTAICNKKCDSCTLFKPFSSLYNTGLLGIVSKNNVQTEELSIHFRSTGETIIQTNEELLPHRSLYFLHPMVTNKIESSRRDKNKDFFPCKEFIVGDGYLLDDERIAKVRRREYERMHHEDADVVFLSSTCHDLHDCRKMIYRVLLGYDYFVVMSENNNFTMPKTDTNSYDHCLDMVTKCSQLIYIIGERYGGPYRGTRYKWLADEIKQINPALGEPSISLMEFFLAKKKNLITRVFTKKDIYNERNTYVQNKNSGAFTPAFVRDKRVFEILSTITKLKSGNWIKTYEDLDDLLEILKIEFGDSKWT